MAPGAARPEGGTSLELAALKALVERRFGLALRPEDDARHASVVAELTSTRGLGAILDGLTSQELGLLADRLTVNETSFFRNAEHFAALRSLVLPELLGIARQERRAVRVLSAGCASGEEAYSIAIALEGVGAAPREIAVTAVDLSPAVLERARRARFSAWSLRATPDALRSRYFSRDGQEWVLLERVAASVHFELGNLADPHATFWAAGPYDLILCRNVLMYFSAEAMHLALGRLEQALRMGGYLFLGHAESLRSRTTPSGTHEAGVAPFFMQVRNAQEAYFYKKVPLPKDQVPTAHDGQTTPAGVATRPPEEPPDPEWFEHIGRQGERIATLHAAALQQEAEPAEAAKSVAAAPGADPSATPGRTRIAEALSALESGRFDEVERLCATLMEDPDAHYLLALLREHLDDPEGAIAHYQMASALDSGFAMPRVHLGIVLSRLGDHDAARRAFAEAVVLLPSESDERLVWFGGGFTREGLSDHCRRKARAEEVRLG